MYFLRRSACLLLFLCTVLFLSAQANTSLPIDPNVKMGVLPNGMKYYIQHNEKPEDRAALRLVIRAGSLQEDEDQLGIAHFVEHMAFNGTEHFEKNELVSYLEKTGTRFGADLNAYTSFEETVYMLEARTDSMELLKKGLLILEDWAGGLSFDPEEVDKERGVVISEWRSRLSPDQRLQQAYFPVLYNDSRYAERLPIGKPEIIENASYATIKRFYEDWYRPDLMAVIATGDFDVEWMESQIKERFSRLKNPEVVRERTSYNVPSHDSTLFVIATDKEAPFTRVRIVYKHPSIALQNKIDFRQQLSRLLYNRMLNARLQEVQLQADPPFTFAYSGYGSDVDSMDTYTIYAFVKEGGATEGIKAVLESTHQAVQHGFLNSELERQKKDMLESARKAAREQDKIRSSNLASRYVYHFLDNIPIPNPQQRLALYEDLLPGISVADINPLPKKWLTKENRVVIVTGPELDTSPLPSEEEILQVIDETEQKTLSPYTDQVNNAPLMDKLPRPRPTQRSKYLGALDITEIVLQNGIKVYLKPTDFQNDQILMSAFSAGGHSLYSDEDYYSASSAGAVVNQSGLADFSNIELQKKLTGKQLSVAPYIGELYEGFSGSSSPQDLETMLQLIHLYFTQAKVDSIALASYISRQSSIFENILVNPYYYFGAQRNKVKYDNHIRRRMTTAEDLKQIELETVKKVYEDRFADPADFTFIFVGNFEAVRMQQLVEQYLGSLPSIKRPEQWKDTGARLVNGKTEEIIFKGEAPKSIVEISYHGDFQYESENRYYFNTLLSTLRIRLREQLREDKSGVYGVNVSGRALPEPEPFYNITISFNCDPTRVEELTAVLEKEIKSFKAEGPTTEELEKVKETQKQSVKKGLKENRFWLGQIETRLQYDIPLDGLLMTQYYKYNEQVTTRDIKEAASTYFSGKNIIKMILMPEEK